MKTDHIPPKPPKRSSVGNWKLPEYCSCCDAKNSTVVLTLPSIQEIKGEEVTCEVPKYQCTECKATFMSPAQATEGVKLAVAAYQLKHGLLTAKQIKDARKKHIISSAAKLATLIGSVSPATLKRIEAGVHVQDKSTDVAIRQAIDEISKDKQGYFVLFTSHYKIFRGISTKEPKKKSPKPRLNIRGVDRISSYQGYELEESPSC